MATHRFAPIAPISLVHQAAHDFMCHLKTLGTEQVDELRPERACMKDEVEYWHDFERRCAEEPDEGDEPQPFAYEGVDGHDFELIVDLINEALGDRPSEDLWLYDYSDEQRLSDDAWMDRLIEDDILKGNTKFLKPHALEAGTARLKAKGLL